MIALLYDVHGNLPALEAVLADVGSAGADSFVLGGDFSAFGGWPAECVARLRELPDATWLRGNWERWAAHPEDVPDDDALHTAGAAVREALGDDVGRLAELPATVRIGETLFVHGSPASDVDSFQPSPEAEDAARLAGADDPRVVFGHTHLQFTRPGPGGVELVNPGAVGMPWDEDPRAAWALLHDDGRVELRRTAYDVERAAAAAVGPDAARRLREARF